MKKNMEVTSQDVKKARSSLRVSQPQFARLLRVSPETVKKWEQGRNPIPGLAAQWILALKVRPVMARELLLALMVAMID